MNAARIPRAGSRPSVTGPADAPVLVLANSLGATREMWSPQVAALARSFRVVRFDVRGHGDAPSPTGPYSIDDLVDDLLALLDGLGVARAHLAGLSLGGMIGMRVAIRAPERVERLVLLATSARLGPPEAWAARARTVLADGMAAVCDAVVARWFTPGFASANPALVNRMRAMFVASDPVGYAGCCGAIERMDQTADLGRIAAPTLVLVGSDDPATPPTHAGIIADAIPGARRLVIPDAAHLLNVEQPHAVTAAMLEHLMPDRPEPER